VTDDEPTEDEIKAKLATPNAERVWYIRLALLLGGMTVDEVTP
jgi:carbamoyl-phosphate synthase large subunit